MNVSCNTKLLSKIIAIFKQEYDLDVKFSELKIIPSERNIILYLPLTKDEKRIKIKVFKDRDSLDFGINESLMLCNLFNLSNKHPKLYKNKKEMPFSSPDDEDYVFHVTEYINGVVGVSCENTYSFLGSSLAKLHTDFDLLNKFSIPELPQFSPCSIIDSVVAEISLKLQSSYDIERLNKISEWLIEQNEWDNEDYKLCHGDAHYYNLILSENKEYAKFIDFEDACLAPRVYDLATIVWSTLNKKRTQHLWASALQSYNNILPIDKSSLNKLPLYVAVRQFWWMRLQLKNWGHYSIHSNFDEFFISSIDLTETICKDACGMQ